MSDDVGYGKVRAATWPQGRPAPATRRGGTDPAEVLVAGWRSVLTLRRFRNIL